VNLLRRRKEKLKRQKGADQMLASQGYKESKNEEVNLPFTFYLVHFTFYLLSPLAFPTVLDVQNI
jgi:hypothetical protein